MSECNKRVSKSVWGFIPPRRPFSYKTFSSSSPIGSACLCLNPKQEACNRFISESRVCLKIASSWSLNISREELLHSWRCHSIPQQMWCRELGVNSFPSFCYLQYESRQPIIKIVLAQLLNLWNISRSYRLSVVVLFFTYSNTILGVFLGFERNVVLTSLLDFFVT